MQDESRGMWQIYLDQQDYKSAFRHCKSQARAACLCHASTTSWQPYLTYCCLLGFQHGMHWVGWVLRMANPVLTCASGFTSSRCCLHGHDHAATPHQVTEHSNPCQTVNTSGQSDESSLIGTLTCCLFLQAERLDVCFCRLRETL